jgi:hypothetical protein
MVVPLPFSVTCATHPLEVRAFCAAKLKQIVRAVGRFLTEWEVPRAWAVFRRRSALSVGGEVRRQPQANALQNRNYRDRKASGNEPIFHRRRAMLVRD